MSQIISLLQMLWFIKYSKRKSYVPCTYTCRPQILSGKENEIHKVKCGLTLSFKTQH
jgi:hypothetical protein